MAAVTHRHARSSSTSGTNRQRSRERRESGLLRVRLVAPALLAPHRASPSVQPITPWNRRAKFPVPTILLSYEAYCDTMFLIAEAGAYELAWLGAVRELGKAQYLIDRIFLFRQRVSLTHCELDTDDIGVFLDGLLQEDPPNRTLANRLRFWGHLHPVDPAPTRTDEKQTEVFAVSPWFIRGIFTRSGHAAFTFFDYQRGVQVHDCPWGIAVVDGGRRAAIAADVRNKVQRIPLTKEVSDGVQLTSLFLLGRPTLSQSRGR